MWQYELINSGTCVSHPGRIVAWEVRSWIILQTGKKQQPHKSCDFKATCYFRHHSVIAASIYQPSPQTEISRVRSNRVERIPFFFSQPHVCGGADCLDLLTLLCVFFWGQFNVITAVKYGHVQNFTCLSNVPCDSQSSCNANRISSVSV